MKWVFLLALMVCTPALAGLLRSQPKYLVHTCFALGVSIFAIGPKLWAAPIPWPGWPGPVKGLEVSFVDGIAVALIVATKGVRIPTTIKLAFAVYSLAIVISTFAAFQKMASLFYAWQLFRTALLLVAVARVSVTERNAPAALVAGLGVGILYEAGLVLSQVAKHATRPGGNFPHANFLGLAADFAVFANLSLLLGSRRLALPGATIFAGFIIAVFGQSRATMGLFALGVVLTIFLSVYHKKSSRKYAFAGAAALGLLVAGPIMLWASGQRTAEMKQSSDAERAAMKVAARMIIADHPFGVGANQYVVVANTEGYSARAGVAWNEDNRAAPVHDTYYLITAELGWIGLVGLLMMLASFIALGVKSLRRPIPGEIGELLPGLLATMILVAIHINFEFVFMDFVLHYLFAISAGMLVAANALAKKSARAPIPAPPAFARAAVSESS